MAAVTAGLMRLPSSKCTSGTVVRLLDNASERITALGDDMQRTGSPLEVAWTPCTQSDKDLDLGDATA